MGHGREALILVKPRGKAFETKWTVECLITEDEESVEAGEMGFCADTECPVLWMQREQRLLEKWEEGRLHHRVGISPAAAEINRRLPKKTSWSNS